VFLLIVFEFLHGVITHLLQLLLILTVDLPLDLSPLVLLFFLTLELLSLRGVLGLLGLGVMHHSGTGLHSGLVMGLVVS
jgi:hypothetical protein